MKIEFLKAVFPFQEGDIVDISEFHAKLHIKANEAKDASSLKKSATSVKKLIERKKE